jgi:hypothetical protein
MNVKLAFVGLPPTTDGFGVRIARNRGVMAKVFSTQQEALTWWTKTWLDESRH